MQFEWVFWVLTAHNHYIVIKCRHASFVSELRRILLCPSVEFCSPSESKELNCRQPDFFLGRPLSQVGIDYKSLWCVTNNLRDCLLGPHCSGQGLKEASDTLPTNGFDINWTRYDQWKRLNISMLQKQVQLPTTKLFWPRRLGQMRIFRHFLPTEPHFFLSPRK